MWPFRTDTRILELNRKLKGQAGLITQLRAEVQAADRRFDAYKRIQERLREAEKDANARRIQAVDALTADLGHARDAARRHKQDNARMRTELEDLGRTYRLAMRHIDQCAAAQTVAEHAGDKRDADGQGDQ